MLEIRSIAAPVRVCSNKKFLIIEEALHLKFSYLKTLKKYILLVKFQNTQF